MTIWIVELRKIRYDAELGDNRIFCKIVFIGKIYEKADGQFEWWTRKLKKFKRPDESDPDREYFCDVGETPFVVMYPWDSEKPMPMNVEFVPHRTTFQRELTSEKVEQERIVQEITCQE